MKDIKEFFENLDRKELIRSVSDSGDEQIRRLMEDGKTEGEATTTETLLYYPEFLIKEYLAAYHVWANS
jgi:hypothetical protein